MENNTKKRSIPVKLGPRSEFLRLGSNEEGFDFAHSNIQAEFYFDEKHRKSVFLRIAVGQQVQRGVYQVNVPEGAKTARVEIESTTGTDKLDLIEVGVTERDTF
jgi:hypothetical protein